MFWRVLFEASLLSSDLDPTTICASYWFHMLVYKNKLLIASEFLILLKIVDRVDVQINKKGCMVIVVKKRLVQDPS